MINVFCRSVVICLIFLVLATVVPAGFAANTPRMRPYAGIGLVVISGKGQQLPLYEEPGLLRIGTLDSSRLSGNEWIFGQSEGTQPLVVSARKGDWVRVYYDDAGREAWIDTLHAVHFQSWEAFLKLQVGRMLPGLQSLYYRLQQKPGGKLLATLTPNQVFKVLRLENSWAIVLTDQGQMGWLRWCDDDGRLTVGIGKK